ncbi:LacI family transcriptional regulator, partial [Pseudoalteromonas sp. S1650]
MFRGDRAHSEIGERYRGYLDAVSKAIATPKVLSID